MSIRRQQNEHLDSLNNFGTDADELIFENELDLIDVVAGKFIERVKNNIENEAMIVTGKIDDISIQRTEVGFDILANKYLLYQDLGVNGSVNKLYNTPFSFHDRKPPVQPILDWVNARNIGGNNPESAAYAIREKIFQDGMEPKQIFSREIPQLADELTEAYANLTINLFLH